METDQDSPIGIDHLFRQESGRLIAMVARIFGLHNLSLAEDVVQDAFSRALEIWKIRGVPENPSAWLLAAAKNRAIDSLRRERTARTFAPEVDRLLRSEWTLLPTVEELFAEGEIKDDLLRMMFSCCQPKLTDDARVAVILNILCGFSVGEIAAAFVATPSAIQKRIARAKKVLAQSQHLFELSTTSNFSVRLPAVQRSLYLLFNEGYHGASAERVVRVELCQEAMRLTALLLAHPLGATPATYALSALMCFNAARLPARLDSLGNLNALADQNRAVWDRELISEGLELLARSASGREATEYHIEAAIASLHATAARMEDTNWHRIVSLYDSLFEMRPSPVVALNRAIAIAQSENAERGLEEIGKIQDLGEFSRYPFYEAALGELELRTGKLADARRHFCAARALARNRTESNFLDRRINACDDIAQS
jgi:RNA polymerase sigma-70 factor (ECF subfamily)